MSRYEGKPLLRLLECFVLDSIGALSSRDRDNLDKMTPSLQKLYHAEGDWRAIISKVMNFPEAIGGHIQNLWKRNCQLAAQHGQELLAEDFARKIVDDNFA